MNCLRQILVIAISCIAVAPSVTQQSRDLASTKTMSYELYSWPEAHGLWSFSLLPSPSGREIYAEEVFDKKFLLRGLHELKQKISELPEGTTVYWLEKIAPNTGPTAKEVENLTYPSPKTIQEIRRYAETRKIKIELLADHKVGG